LPDEEDTGDNLWHRLGTWRLK